MAAGAVVVLRPGAPGVLAYALPVLVVHVARRRAAVHLQHPALGVVGVVVHAVVGHIARRVIGIRGQPIVGGRRRGEVVATPRRGRLIDHVAPGVDGPAQPLAGLIRRPVRHAQDAVHVVIRKRPREGLLPRCRPRRDIPVVAASCIVAVCKVEHVPRSRRSAAI